MSRELEGKVGIVTGIGKAIALAFGAADARVVVNHLDRADLADTVVAHARQRQRPRLRPADRAFIAALARLLPHGRRADSW
jgi:NAD(P)-dependent dehydrogenase (short-subunit alcohol dehydrogenase family)